MNIFTHLYPCQVFLQNSSSQVEFHLTLTEWGDAHRTELDPALLMETPRQREVELFSHRHKWLGARMSVKFPHLLDVITGFYKQPFLPRDLHLKQKLLDVFVDLHFLPLFHVPTLSLQTY